MAKKRVKKKAVKKSKKSKKPVKKKKTSRKKTKKPARKRKVARKKTAKKKSTSRKKTVKKKKGVTRKKPVKKKGKKPRKKAVKKAAAGKKPASKVKKRAAVPAKVGTASTGAAARGEERLGVITHYYNHLSVAVVKLDRGILRAGDRIHIKGHTTDIDQRVDSMEIDHQAISQASAGQEFGMKVGDHVREHDLVYKIKP